MPDDILSRIKKECKRQGNVGFVNIPEYNDDGVFVKYFTYGCGDNVDKYKQRKLINEHMNSKLNYGSKKKSKLNKNKKKSNKKKSNKKKSNKKRH